MSDERETERIGSAIAAAAGHLGLDLLSYAHMDDDHRGRFHESIRDIAATLPRAVSLGIRLSGPVLDTVATAPTWTYYHHYRQVNTALDQAALLISGAIQRGGYRALPVPASQILDWELLRAHLSHREIAWLAGLGWRGRNNLLVTPEYGSMIRLATVLTDAPLPRPVRSRLETECGDCAACIGACPVGAIDASPERFDLDRCAAQLRRFSREERLNTMICGLCVKVCAGTEGRRRETAGAQREGRR
ncbi:MAG: hypothetical protein PHQ19_02915 [Candidatus Krumholzibacteria bacterium]|nr:hypothetical protein [Candidatus Krumholzibacteria bacterium]